MLKIDKNILQWLENTYFFCNEYGDLESSIFVLLNFDAHISKTGSRFDPDTTIENPYLFLEGNLLGNSQYHFHDDIADGKYVLFVFTIPDNFENDYQLILKGKYSQISSKAKELINSFWLSKDLNDILIKDDKFREIRSSTLEIDIPKNQEVWSVPDIIKETFVENNLIISKI